MKPRFRNGFQFCVRRHAVIIAGKAAQLIAGLWVHGVSYATQFFGA